MQIKLTRTNVTICKGVGGRLRGTHRAEIPIRGGVLLVSAYNKKLTYKGEK